MIRVIRPNAMAQDDATMVTGWNVAPNRAYVLRLLPGASSCGVLLYDEDGSALIASGAALAGTDQPCALIPQTGQTVDMVDADLGWHLLLTTTGTESQRTIRIGPAVDLPDEIHPVYGDEDMALARATAAIDEGAHYRDDVTVTCPLGLGAGLGDVASVPVDGAAVVGQVESITWTATPDGATDQAVIRRHVAIAPEAFVEPEPPTVADDAGSTDAATTTSGNVLTNDEAGLTVVAVNGLSANVGVAVDGDNGGSFTVAANGAWTFDPDGDFGLLAGEETADTSISYHASDGTAEAMATLTVTVSADPSTGDPLWDDVALLIQAPTTGSVIADAKGHAVSVGGGTAVSTALGHPTIYFDGNGDDLLVGAAGDFNLLHDGSSWTLDFIFRPSRTNTDDTLVCTNGGSTSNRGLFLGFNAGKLQMFTSNGSTYVVGSATVSARTFDYTFAVNTEYHVAVDYDLSRASNHARLYVNGVHVASLAKTANAPSAANSLQMLVGLFSRSYPAYAYQGHIRALRMTAGLRDVSTTPTWPYPEA